MQIGMSGLFACEAGLECMSCAYVCEEYAETRIRRYTSAATMQHPLLDYRRNSKTIVLGTSPGPSLHKSIANDLNETHRISAVVDAKVASHISNHLRVAADKRFVEKRKLASKVYWRQLQ